MSKFGKALKPVDVDRLINFVKNKVNKPYKPRRTSLKLPEVKPRRKAKKGRVYHKRERDTHGYTLYYDRNRKGWFYRDEEGNRYGVRGSKDKGFAHKKNAIDALQRRWRKEQKKEIPPVGPEPIPSEIPDFPDPEPIPVIDGVIVEYDMYCNQCRRDCYGSKAPSGSLYLEFFRGFEEDKPKVDIGGYSREHMEEKDGNFSITLMLSYQDLRPVYEDFDGVELVVGLEDL